MSKALETVDLLEMARSLVCLMSKDEVRAMLDGEGYSKVDVEEFIEYCES